MISVMQFIQNRRIISSQIMSLA